MFRYFVCFFALTCFSFLGYANDNHSDFREEQNLYGKIYNAPLGIDGIIKEPAGGAHSNPEEIFATVKKEINVQLGALLTVSDADRVNNRIDKFCSMGVVRKN